MKFAKFVSLLVFALLTLGASYYSDASFTHTVLVTTAAPVAIPRMKYASSCELCNDGPNDEFCSAGAQNPQDAGCTVFPDGGLVAKIGGGMKVPSGQCKPLPYIGLTQLCCVVSTADQIDGGGTEINEAP